MKWYMKEIPTAPIYVMGQPYRFDFLATEDPLLIAELDKCIRLQRGGVISITEAEYIEEVKKKESTQSGPNSNGNPSRRQELVSPQFQHLNLGIDQDGRRVAAVVANPSPRRGGLLAQPALPQRESIQAPNIRGGNGEMPDPIQIPTPAQFAKPPTAKLNEIK